ncbi:MAG: amidohydrolase family protein, partial [Candidatus Limnocylindria bacterium]
FGRGDAWAQAHEVLRDGHASAMRAAVGARVRLLVGTDSVGCYAEEVDLLRRAGISPVESLRACTSNAAAALGRSADLGAIAPGMAADLIALRGDPLADPYALESPVWVVRSGHRYDPQLLAYAARISGAGSSLAELVRAPRPGHDRT